MGHIIIVATERALLTVPIYLGGDLTAIIGSRLVGGGAYRITASNSRASCRNTGYSLVAVPSCYRGLADLKSKGCCTMNSVLDALEIKLNRIRNGEPWAFRSQLSVTPPVSCGPTRLSEEKGYSSLSFNSSQILNSALVYSRLCRYSSTFFLSKWR